MAPEPSARGHRAFVRTAAAFVWSIALVVAALVVPVYGSATLVDENGQGVLLVVAVPAVITAAAWIALWRKCTRGSRFSGHVAWLCVSLLALFCFVGAMTIGVFAVPVAILLARATSLTPSAMPPSAPISGLG